MSRITFTQRLIVAISVIAIYSVATLQHAAADLVVNYTSPVNISTNTASYPCISGPGELVTVSGSVHTVLAITTNGGGFRLTSHSNFERLSGTGATTGSKYVSTGAVNSSFKDLPGGTTTATFTSSARLVGPQGNFVVNVVFHLTVNANGDITVDRTETSISCT